jgi:hypothetical protein
MRAAVDVSDQLGYVAHGWLKIILMPDVLHTLLHHARCRCAASSAFAGVLCISGK